MQPLTDMTTCTKELYERMRHYAREFNRDQRLRYPVLSVMAVNDDGECEFDKADSVLLEVYEFPEDNACKSIVSKMQRRLNIDLHLSEWPTITESSDWCKIEGWELGIIPIPSGSTECDERDKAAEADAIIEKFNKMMQRTGETRYSEFGIGITDNIQRILLSDRSLASAMLDWYDDPGIVYSKVSTPDVARIVAEHFLNLGMLGECPDEEISRTTHVYCCAMFPVYSTRNTED